MQSPVFCKAINVILYGTEATMKTLQAAMSPEIIYKAFT